MKPTAASKPQPSHFVADLFDDVPTMVRIAVNSISAEGSVPLVVTVDDTDDVTIRPLSSEA